MRRNRQLVGDEESGVLPGEQEGVPLTSPAAASTVPAADEDEVIHITAAAQDDDETLKKECKPATSPAQKALIEARSRLVWSVATMVSVLLLVAAGISLYIRSLKPFVDEWDMVDSMPAVAAEVIISSLCFVLAAGLILMLRSRLLTRLWMPALVLVVLSYILLLSFTDHGGLLSEHGTYNSGASVLMTLIFATPVVVLMASYRLLFRSKTKPFVIVNSCILTVIIVTLASLLIHAHDIWPNGYNGHTLQAIRPLCNIPTPTLMWEDLWPKFLLKWIVDIPCWEKPGKFSTWDHETGVFTIDCDESLEATITAYPYTEWDNLEGPWDKFRDHILSRGVLFNPAPRSLNLSWANAVLATCGTKRDLLLNIRRNETAVKLAIKNGAHSSPPPPPPPPSPATAPHNAPVPKMNVLVLMVDTMSRNMVRRLLEKTHGTLKEIAGKKDHTHKMFQFFRYHTVGFNSNPNWKPLMYNQRNSSWSYFGDARASGFVSFHLWEKCEFYWEWHRGNPDVSPWSPYCLPEYQLKDSESLYLVGPYAIRRRCLTGKNVHEYSFEYLKTFWKVYHDLPKWGFFGLLEAHDALGNVAGLMDDDLSGILSGRDIDINNTAIFLISDHGWHCSFMFVNKLHSAVVENRLPIMIGLLPKAVLEKYPHLADSLEANEQALFTAADLRQTFTHLLQGHTPKDSPAAGYSLFGGPIPNRNCSDANIPPEICICN